MTVIRRLRPAITIRMPGSPDRPVRPPRERQRVERRRADFLPPTPQATPCVLWQGPLDRHGYGRMKVPTERGVVSTGPHRWVMDVVTFAETGRHLTPAEFVLHLCDNPPCFRVDHLMVGTVQENNQQMFDRGRASPPPVNVFFGEEHPGAKLTEALVRQIRDEHRAGMTQVQLALRHGVSRTAIRKVVTGKTWAQVQSAPEQRWGAAPERTRRVKRGGC